MKEDDSQIESQSVPETANVSLVSSDTPVSTDSIPAPDKDEAQQELEPAAAVTEDDSKTLNKTGNDNYLNTSLENKQHEADVSEVMYEGAANQDIEADGKCCKWEFNFPTNSFLFCFDNPCIYLNCLSFR